MSADKSPVSSSLSHTSIGPVTEQVWRSSSPDRGCPCEIARLQARSQVDFEIEFFEQALSRSPLFREVLAALAECLSQKGWHRRALTLDRRLVVLRPRDVVAHYNLACSLAQVHELDEAVHALERAVQLGLRCVEVLDVDSDLAPLAGHPRFEALRESLRQDSSRDRSR